MAGLYMYMMGILAIAYTFRFNKQLLRIDLKGIGRFLLMLVSITGVRVLLFYLFPDKGSEIISILSQIEWWQAILAGFEEAMFTLPMYYIARYTDKKYIKYLLMGALALTFGIGHLYQGIHGVLITSYYMLAIAPKYMKKYGFYTMVVAHALFDLSGVFFIKYSYLLQFN